MSEADPGSLQSRTFIKSIRLLSDTVLKLCKQKPYFTGLIDICPFPSAGCVPCLPAKKLPVRFVIPAGHNAKRYTIYYKINNFNDSTSTGFIRFKSDTINNIYNVLTNSYSPNAEIVINDSINFVKPNTEIVFFAEVYNLQGYTDVPKVYNAEYDNINLANPRIWNTCPKDSPKDPILSVDSTFGRNLTTKLRIKLPSQHNIDRFEIYRVTASNALRKIGYVPTGSIPSFITDPQFQTGFTTFSKIEVSNNSTITYNLMDSIYGYWQQGIENGTYPAPPPCNINCWLFNQCPPNLTPNGCNDGEYKYRIIVYPTNTTLSSFILDFPVTTICNACPARPPVVIEGNNLPLSSSTNIQTYNNTGGTFKLKITTDNFVQPRLTRLEVYEANYNPTEVGPNIGNLIKTINITNIETSLFNGSTFLVDILNKKNGSYKYVVKSYNGEKTFTSRPIVINVIGNAPICLGTYADKVGLLVQGSVKNLKFNFNIKVPTTVTGQSVSVCNLTSYRISYYKLKNSIPLNLLASNSSLGLSQVSLLPLGPVQYSNVGNNINKTIIFTANEISTNKFQRLATPRPPIGGSWYRFDLECLSCGANSNSKITKYAFLTN